MNYNLLQSSRNGWLLLRKFHRVILEAGKPKARGASGGGGKGEGTTTPVQRYRFDVFAVLSFHQKGGIFTSNPTKKKKKKKKSIISRYNNSILKFNAILEEI